MQLQVFYSLLDHVFHSKPIIGKSTTDILEEVQNKYYSIPYVPGTVNITKWKIENTSLLEQ